MRWIKLKVEYRHINVTRKQNNANPFKITLDKHFIKYNCICCSYVCDCALWWWVNYLLQKKIHLIYYVYYVLPERDKTNVIWYFAKGLPSKYRIDINKIKIDNDSFDPFLKQNTLSTVVIASLCVHCMQKRNCYSFYFISYFFHPNKANTHSVYRDFMIKCLIFIYAKYKQEEDTSDSTTCRHFYSIILVFSQ